MRYTGLVTIILATFATTSCSDAFGPDRDFEGFYSYAGTVDDAFGDAVSGTITITRQRGNRADVTIDWSYFDRGVEIVRIVSETPAVADISDSGRIEFEFEGELRSNGDFVDFRLIHEGRLRRNTIEGEWELRTDIPTTDFGAFIARR
jgi:hypothetical protein